MTISKVTTLLVVWLSGLVISVSAQAPPPVSFQIKGAWNDSVNFPFPGSPAYSAFVGDLNGDGKLDVFMPNRQFGAAGGAMMTGNGDGTFHTVPDGLGNGGGYSITGGDLLGDGSIVLGVPWDCCGVGFAFKDDHGGFGADLLGSPYWDGGTPHFALFGDFDKDGKLDLAVTLGSGGGGLLGCGDIFGPNVAVFLAAGQPAGYSNWCVSGVYPAGTNPESFAMGDFNGDGNLDFIVPNCAGPGCPENEPGVSSISVLLGYGNGTFRSGPTYPWGTSAFSVAVGDFNHDGKLDFATSDGYDSNIGVFIGNGDGTFKPPVNNLAGFSHWNVVASDFNSDGTPDLAVCIDSEAAVAVFLGNGNGTFQPAAKFPIPFDSSKTGPQGVCETIAVGDFSGDGRPDIVVFDEHQQLMEVLLNTGTFANTTAGSYVGVQPADTTTNSNPVSLIFSNVTQTGLTALTTSGSGGTTAPSGFQLGSPATYYNISTTSTFTGPVSICISYSGTSFNDQTNLRLFHFTNGTWTDITTSVDLAHKSICGSTNSFSPFAVAQPIYSAQVQQPINADGSSVFSVKKGVVPVKFNLSAAGVSTCSLPQASIALTRTSGSSPGAIDENVYQMSSDNGGYFRISSCQYIYNVSAQSLGTGVYRADIVVGSQVVGSGVFGLK